jgi:hypothetical protein
MEKSAFVQRQCRKRRNAQTIVAVVAACLFAAGVLGIAMHLFAPHILFLSSGQTYVYEPTGNSYWYGSLFVDGGGLRAPATLGQPNQCEQSYEQRRVGTKEPLDLSYAFAPLLDLEVTFAWSPDTTQAPRVELWNNASHLVMVMEDMTGRAEWKSPPDTHFVRFRASSDTTVNVTVMYSFPVSFSNQTRVAVPWSHERPRITVQTALGLTPAAGMDSSKMCVVDQIVRIYPEPRMWLVALLVCLYGVLYALVIALTGHVCSAYARDPSFRAAMRVSIELSEPNGARPFVLRRSG